MQRREASVANAARQLCIRLHPTRGNHAWTYHVANDRTSDRRGEDALA